VITALGTILIPAAIFCFLLRPFYLLPLLLISSLFEVASVFNGAIGDYIFGVPPFYFVEVLIAVRLALLLKEKGRLLPSRNSPTRPLAWLLIVYWGWAVASSFIMPRLFAGMPVYSPREGVDVELSALAPLTWSLSNLAQATYLTLNVAVLFYTFLAVKTETLSKVMTKAFYWTAIIASIAGIVQLLAATFGLSYPYEIFNNNPAYAQGFDEDIGNYHRITSTFGEPSGAGSFLAAVAVGFLARYLREKHSLTSLISFFVVSLLLLATTATTGYVEFLIAFLLLMAYWNLVQRNNQRRGAQSKVWLLAAGLAAVAGAIVFYNPSFLETMGEVTIEKSGTMSFVHRLTSDAYALWLAKDTWGLGVGLGSNRPSSLIPALISTVGIVGTALFGLIICRIIRLFPGKSAPSYIQMSFWAFITILIGSAVGVPDMNRPALWGLSMVAVGQLAVYAKRQVLVAQLVQQLPSHLGVSLDGSAGIAPSS